MDAVYATVVIEMNENSFSSPPAELASLSARVGSNRMWVQGAGGNSSAKVDDVLWIKASGKWMSRAQLEPVFAAVNLSGVRGRMAAGETDPAMPELLPNSPLGLRPSIETSLHAVLPHPYVMHVHSVNVIARSVCTDATRQLEGRLEGLRWGWVPYVRPGIVLTHAMTQVLRQGPVDVLILANHGLIVGGATADKVGDLLDQVEARLALPARTPPALDVQSLEALSAHTPYRPAPTVEIHAMAIDATQRAIASGGSLYPDHVVFLGPAVVSLGVDQDIAGLLRARQESGREVPAVLLVPERGVLLRKDLSVGALAMVDCLAMVVARIPRSSTVRYLTSEQEAQLLDWDAEKYRKSLPQAGTAAM